MKVLILMAVVCLSACALHDGREIANSIAQEHGFSVQRLETSTFVLFGLLRPGKGDTLHVYIEGDGMAWRYRSRPSSDPTPNNPVGLQLAKADPTTHPVLYLARPCQYVNAPDDRMCRPTYWTFARSSDEVIASMNEAITKAMQRTGTQQLVLVGFSGGGGVAALVAARRHDVRFLGSVAGNLDHKSWTQWHNVTPMNASLNPIDQASALANIPQRHLSSRNDTIMPPHISEKFCRAVGQKQACVVINGVPHKGPWEGVWNYRYEAFDMPHADPQNMHSSQ